MSIGTRRTTALGVAAGLVAVVGVVAQVTAPSGAAPSPEIVPVLATELICPDARAVPGGRTTSQIYAVTPSNLSTDTSGRVLVGTPADPDAIATLTGPSRAVATDPTVNKPAVVGIATGGRAPGFAMDQLTASTVRYDHGLSGVTCTEPDNDLWFAGTASSVGRTSTLYLTDIESTPATVDVTLYGKDGRIDAPGGLGLVVKPNSRRVIALHQLAPGAGDLTVHVTASSGRVGAALFDSQVRGLEPRGADWLPISEPPRTRVVVPGLANGPGQRRLTVFAPGEGTATVTVRLVGQQGSFAPSGAASLEIDRGKVTSVELGEAAARDNTAALVESDVPLVAGVRWTNTTRSTPDFAFSAGTSAITAPAVVAGLRNANGYGSSIMFTALGTAGTVSIQRLIGGVASGPPLTVAVGADRTVRYTVPSAAKGPFAAVITPVAGTGPLHAAVVRTRQVDAAAGTTVSLVRDARISVAVPEALPDLDVGLGR